MTARDARHEAARATVKRGVGKVITTNHVIGETWTVLHRRSGHVAAVGFLDRLQALSYVQIVHVDERTEAEAWRWLLMATSMPPVFVEVRPD